MITIPATRRRLTAAVLLALILMAQVTMGPGFCEPSDLRPAVTTR